MHAQPNLDAERDVLPKIQCTAVAILGGSNSCSDISKLEFTPVPDTPSILLSPHGIIASIMKLPEGFHQELLDCLNNRLNELQERFLTIFRSMCSMARNANDLDAIRQGIGNVYYRRCILPIQLELSRLQDISKHQPKNRSGKRTFNNVSVYCSLSLIYTLMAVLGVYPVT